jgi:hypothetical protein
MIFWISWKLSLDVRKGTPILLGYDEGRRQQRQHHESVDAVPSIMQTTDSHHHQQPTIEKGIITNSMRFRPIMATLFCAQ